MNASKGYDINMRSKTPNLSRGRKGSFTGRWMLYGTVKMCSVIVHETQREVWIPASAVKK